MATYKMGLLVLLKNGKTKNESNERIDAMGWDTITQAYDRAYPGQTNPKHYTAIK